MQKEAIMLGDAQEPRLPLEEDDREPQVNPVEWLWIAWRHKFLILVTAAIGFALGALRYTPAKPVYSSEAQVLVVSKSPNVLAEEGKMLSAPVQSYVNTHLVLMKSPLIVGRAVQEGKLGSLESFAGMGDPTDAVAGRLTVDSVMRDSGGRDNILKVSFSGGVAADCPTVVNAVLESYKKFLAETYRDASADTVKFISEARNILENDLNKTEAAYRDLRENSPMIWRGKDAISPLQDRLMAIEMQRSALVLRRGLCEGQLLAIEKARKAGRSNEEVAALVVGLADKLDPTPSLRSDAGMDRGAGPSLKAQLLPLLIEEQALAENWGPKHPQVLSAQQRIRDARNLYTLPSVAFTAAEGKTGDLKRLMNVNMVDTYLESLKKELDSLKVSEETLSGLCDAERTKTRELSTYEIRAADFEKKIARTQVLYDGVVKRLQEASLVKDYGGFDARVIAPAGIGRQISSSTGLLRAMMVPGILGMLCGVGLVYLIEITDKRFRTPEEIRRRLGLRVMSHIPLIEVDDTLREKAADNGTLDPTLITHYRPMSPEAESFRTIRTALYFSNLGDGHKVLQVTSPEPGDGKTTVSSNLAVSIAQSGKKTLLLDADFRRPRVDKVFGVSSEVGMASVLGQGVELEDAIQECGIENLSVLPAGPRPPDPAELLTSPRFAQLLDMLREKYDYVIVDTPPLLPVTDACVVAPRTDGVILAIRISKHGRAHAERAKDILTTLGAQIVGVVVNGLGTGKSRGYGYRYGYGYGYRYKSRRYGYGGYAGYGHGSYGYGGYGYGGYGYGGYAYGDGDSEADEKADQDAEENGHEREAKVKAPPREPAK
jgi:capsular exopolysaccharide synthesis family protein